jgi:hypothetical protein
LEPDFKELPMLQVSRTTEWRVPRVAALAAGLLALAGCSYAYRNPAEELGPGEVGGRTVAGVEVLIDGVAVSVKGAELDATSRANGRFAMLPLPVGTHTLMFRKGKERALQREVEIAWGHDGQPQGLWLGDVQVPAAVGLLGECAAGDGVTLADNGVAVDEVSGAIVPIHGGGYGDFAFEGLSIGEHRIRVFVSDTLGDRYVGGPATVRFLATDAGTLKTQSRIALHRASTDPADLAGVTFRFGVAGSIPGLKLSDAVVTGFPSRVTLASDGSARVEVAEGIWTVELKLPGADPSVHQPPPVTFVAVAGTTVDLGTLYAVSQRALTEAASSCRTDADCGPAPGTCDASHVCVNWTPTPQASSNVPFCSRDALGCTADTPLTTAAPVTITCGADLAAGVTAGVACGSSCTPDGLATVRGEPGRGGCPALPGTRTSFSISGTISGAVLSSVQVWISSGADTGTNSDATGAWAINGLANGTYTFSPSASGYTFIPASRTVTVSGADALLQDFVAITNVAAGSFAWENPLPQGNQLSGTWSAASNDVWAVGSAGTIMRWNGTAWSSVWSGSTQDLTAVWGTSASDVWAVGAAGTILHWTGFAWASLPSGTTNRLDAVWGSSATDAWAVGVAGTILRWNGTAWASVPSGITAGRLKGVWGSSATDVWAVGDDGGGFSLILHFDGTTWTTRPGGGFYLNGIWGSAANDVWVVDRVGSTSRWNGTAWLAIPSAVGSELLSVWGTAANDVWAVGLADWQHWDGVAWSRLAIVSQSSASAVGGSAAGDVWVVGQGGATSHWDGTAWTSGTTGTWIRPLTGAWASAWNDAWAVGGVGLLHSSGAGWSSVTSPSNFVHAAVWGSAPYDVWVTGWFATFVLHWNGTAWSMVTTPSTGYLFSIWGSSASDVWAVGSAGSILHWDGTSWAKAASGTVAGLNGVWGRSATDAWAVGDGGTILHWNGTAWSAVTAPSISFRSVWGASSSDVWAVGYDMTTFAGAIAHWDGTAWSSVPIGAVSMLSGAWGFSSQDVWAVGDLGTVLHWDGVAWAVVPSGTANALYAVVGLPGWGPLVVGQDNAVLRFR